MKTRNRKKIVRVIITILVLLGLMLAPISLIHASDITSETLINLANKERVEKNLPALFVDSSLNQAAQMKAEDMISKDYFDHYGPDGNSPWDFIMDAGYNYSTAGENLAVYFEDARSINDAWMASPTHRANILNKDYKNIAVSVARGSFEGHQTYMVVEMFGAPKVTVEELTSGLIIKIRDWLGVK